MEGDYWNRNGFTGLIARAILRTLQFIFAVVVTILYGLDLHVANKDHAHADASWVYAEFVAATSILMCIVHLFFNITRGVWWALEWIMCVLWAAQLGVFGSIYLGNGTTLDPSFKPSRSRMTAAVWIDLVNFLLWLATAILAVMNWCSRRKSRRQASQKIVGDEVELENGRFRTSRSTNNVE